MNYFNYFTEIETRFQQRRGSILMLSTLDWALIETWREAGVPLEAVLRGIDAAFDNRDKQRAHLGNRRQREINGLAWCYKAVIEAVEQSKEAAIGATSTQPTEPRESGFETARIAHYLERNALLLAQAATDLAPPASTAAYEAAKRLRELAVLEETASNLEPGTLNLEELDPPSPSSKRSSSPRFSLRHQRPSLLRCANRPPASPPPAEARCRPSRSGRCSSSSSKSGCSKPTRCRASASSTCPTRSSSEMPEPRTRNLEPRTSIPPCPHFGPCGGCQLQHLTYAAQLSDKAAQLRGLLVATGIALPELQIHPSPPLAYRNRIRLTLAEVDGQLRAGYLNSSNPNNQQPATHNQRRAFLPITVCPIAAPILWRVTEAFLASINEQPRLWLRNSSKCQTSSNSSPPQTSPACNSPSTCAPPQ